MEGSRPSKRRFRDALALRNDRGHPKIDLIEFDRVRSGLPNDLRIVCDAYLDTETIEAVARTQDDYSSCS